MKKLLILVVALLTAQGAFAEGASEWAFAEIQVRNQEILTEGQMISRPSQCFFGLVEGESFSARNCEVAEVSEEVLNRYREFMSDFSQPTPFLGEALSLSSGPTGLEPRGLRNGADQDSQRILEIRRDGVGLRPNAIIGGGGAGGGAG